MKRFVSDKPSPATLSLHVCWRQERCLFPQSQGPHRMSADKDTINTETARAGGGAGETNCQAAARDTAKLTDWFPMDTFQFASGIEV